MLQQEKITQEEYDAGVATPLVDTLAISDPGNGCVTAGGAAIEKRLQKIADRDRDTRASASVDALMTSAASSATRTTRCWSPGPRATSCG